MALPGLAQEKPATLTGVVSTGVYTTDNQNGRQARFSTIPANLNLDFSGYVGIPDFISYRVRPQFALGAQAPEAGFTNGNGLSLSTTFLRKRAFPLTVTYSNLQREQLSYGSLSRVSGLRSTSHNRDFGLNWQLRHRNLPHLSFDLGRSRNTLDPDQAVIPAYESRSHQYVLQVDDNRLGWKLKGSLRWTDFSSDFANPLEPDFITAELDRTSSQYRFSADRPLGKQSSLVLSGGVLDSRNTFNDRPFDQDVRFLNAMLSFAWGERWRGGLRTGYTSNLLGTEIQETLSQLTGSGGSGSPAPGSLVFVPFETRVSSLFHSGNIRFQAHPDWSLFGSLSRSTVNTPDGLVASSEADTLNGSSGVSFSRRFSWGTITSQYSLNLGRMDFADIPNSRIRGQAFTVIAQRGSLDGWELNASITGSTQRVDQTHPLRTNNHSAEFSLGRRVAALVLRGSVGVRSSSFRDGGLDYDADGLTFRGSLEHRRIQLRYFRNAIDGNALQALLTDPASSAAISAVLLGVPLRTILSTLRTQTLNLRATPWRRLDTNLTWTKGRQELDQRVSNDYEQVDLRVGYRFRFLTFELGYTRYEQSFLALNEFMRSRFYLRVSRQFRVF